MPTFRADACRLASRATYRGLDPPLAMSPPPPGRPTRRAFVAQACASLRLAVHPLHNPRRLAQAGRPLVKLPSRRLDGVKIGLGASRDCAVFATPLRAREPALLLPNPWQALQAQAAGDHVIAMAGDTGDFKGASSSPAATARCTCPPTCATTPWPARCRSGTRNGKAST
jgi:hypothetical protein